MMLIPKKIQECIVKLWRRELSFIHSSYQGTLTKPLIKIPDPNFPNEYSNTKPTKPAIEKLTLSRNLILTHVLHILYEVIDILSDIDIERTMCSLAQLRKIKSTLQRKNACDWDKFIIPRHEGPLHTDQLKSLILEHIHNL